MNQTKNLYILLCLPHSAARGNHGYPDSHPCHSRIYPSGGRLRYFERCDLREKVRFPGRRYRLRLCRHFLLYTYYAPTTFIVKFLVALTAATLYKILTNHGVKELIAMIPCGLADIFFVVTGYFIHSYITEGVGPALLSVPSNAVQGCSGLVVAAILLPILTAVPDIKRAKLCMNHE